MSTKHSRRPPTHKPLPWCKKTIPTILIPPGSPLTLCETTAFFFAHPPSGAPRDVSFYFHQIDLSPTGAHQGTATTGELTAIINFTINYTTKTIGTSVTLYSLSGPLAVLQNLTVSLPDPRPLQMNWPNFPNTIPPGQRGRVTLWQ
jgi:hypothetical protein